MVATAAFPIWALGLLNWGVFNTLKASARNWRRRLALLLKGMSLNSDRSNCLVPGPNRMFLPEFHPFSNLIEVYMLRLRRKINVGHDVKLLRTRRGEGYVLTAEAASPHV